MNEKAHQVVQVLCKQKKMIAVAESCTGGLVSSLITQVPGASSVFECGLITYSNQAKIELLGVSKQTLTAYGAVSAQTAGEMAAGALQKSGSVDIAISTTGVAGPDGGTDEKPVGLVYFGLATRDNVETYREIFSGSRVDVQKQAADFILKKLLNKTKVYD